MSFRRWSLAPLRNEYRVGDEGSLPFELSEGVQLDVTPSWIEDLELKEKYGFGRAIPVDNSRFVLRIEYEADSLREEDPKKDLHWTGSKPRSFEDRNEERIQLATLALWLAQPTTLSGEILVHTPLPTEGNDDFVPGRSWGHLLPIWEHSKDSRTVHKKEDLERAALLHARLLKIDRKDSTVWAAIRTTVVALSQAEWMTRYPVSWIVIEGLFGPTSFGELRYRISQRLALFLEEDRAEARTLARRIKKGYDLRSKAVHGFACGSVSDQESSDFSHDAETWIRKSLTKILLEKKLLDIFDGTRRDEFLESLVFG